MASAVAQETIADQIEQVEGEMIYIRLRDLVHSPFNVRQNDTSDVTELAALIHAQTLLQNLVVVPHQTKRGKASASQKYGVVAGGRRRRAMLLLVEQGKMSLDEEVLCKVTTVEQAIRVSAAENSGREPMGPADTVMAFRAMVEAGASPAEVAICFGVSELTVSRRLRLANVSPKLFDLFRAGEIEVEQLAALAISEDHEAQERVWNNTPSYNRSSGTLRRLLIGDAIDASRDAVAQFVGLPAYEAAGGVVRRDLFSEDGTGAILDAELLNTLAMKKLNAEAQRVQKEGWGWAEARPSMDYSERHRFGEAPKGERTPKPKEAARIEALQAEQNAADEALQKLYDENDEPDQDEADKLERVSAKAGAELHKLRSKLRAWTPEVMAQAGVIATIDHSGKLEVLRGLVRPEDKKQVAKTASREAAQARGDDEAGEGAGAAETEVAASHSEALVRKLTAHRTKALQLAMAQNAHVALASVVHVLLMQTVVRYGYHVDSALNIRASDCDSDLTRVADDIQTSPAWVELAGQLENMREHIPGDTDALLRWLIGRPQDRLLELLAMCAALTVNTVTAREQDHAGDALVDALGLDMADWWTPTATGYLNQVPKARIVEAVTEAVDAETAAPLAKAKKGEAVAKAEDLLAGKRWLPTPLRPRSVK